MKFRNVIAIVILFVLYNKIGVKYVNAPVESFIRAHSVRGTAIFVGCTIVSFLALCFFGQKYVTTSRSRWCPWLKYTTYSFILIFAWCANMVITLLPQ